MITGVSTFCIKCNEIFIINFKHLQFLLQENKILHEENFV